MNTTSPGTAGAAPLGAELAAGYPLAESRIALRPVVGELQLRLAAVGHGKSADAYTLVPALARHGVVLFAHTDGSTGSQVRALGLTGAGPNTDIAGSVRITRVLSAQRIAVLLYRAVNATARTGGQLPVALVVDEINQIMWDNADAPTYHDALTRTSQLLLAIAMLDLEQVGNLVGLPYATWAGAPAPDLSGRGIAVIGYATLMRSLSGLAASGRPDLAALPSSALGYRASSIVMLQRHAAAGAAADSGEFVVVKSRRGETPAASPMRFDSNGGYRPHWADVA